MAGDDDTAPVGKDSFESLLGALARSPARPLEHVADVELAPGRRVGRYEVVALLGKGGMGAVYRARDEVLGRDVALKVLFVDVDASPVDRFRREIVALAAVSHENVVAVHDAGVDCGLPYVVLDLVEGQTLRARLDAGALRATEVLRLARELVRGLGAAHAVGVVHRDLKPENILLSRDGTARLVDFGLARLGERADAHELGLTEPGMFLGTVYYMPPEQMRGDPVDHRADYFSLGAVLYEALTGRRAFEARTRVEVITAVLRDQPATDPRLLADEATRRLLGVIFRCLEKTPEQRFQSTGELLDALASEAQSQPSVRAPAALPETRYAASSGAHIAYQVVSSPGPPTLVAAAPFISNIEVMWESPYERTWIESLAKCSHYLHYDRRGVGMSDPIAPECTFDERVEDLRAVLDAEGVDRAYLLGVSEGGPTCIGFAVKYPERARGLILVDAFARLVSGDGYAHGFPRAQYDKLIDKWVTTWGTPKSLSLPLFVASRKNDPEFIRWGNRYERQCASPGTVRRLLHLQFAIDVRALLPQVRCPTLVIHRKDDPAISVEHGRFLGAQIPGARYVELEGVDHAPWHGDVEAPLTLVRELLVSARLADPAR